MVTPFLPLLRLPDEALRTLGWWHTIMLAPMPEVHALLRSRPWGNASMALTVTHTPAEEDNPWTVNGYPLRFSECWIKNRFHVLRSNPPIGGDEFWKNCSRGGGNMGTFRAQDPPVSGTPQQQPTSNSQSGLSPSAFFKDLPLASMLVVCEAWERLEAWEAEIPMLNDVVQTVLTGVNFLCGRSFSGAFDNGGMTVAVARWVERTRLSLAHHDVDVLMSESRPRL